jgi:hypothetical protein
VVPAYHITAIWLIDGTNHKIAVAEAPQSSGLKHGQFYTSKGFLDVLRSLPPVKGIS